jgi:hypothetical protein
MQRITPPALLLVSAAALLALAGCKNFEKTVHAARSDSQIAGDIQTRISSEPAFSTTDSPNVNVAVTNGVATLSGQAPDDHARLIAATDASKVDGVHEVVNDMTLAGEQIAQNQNPDPSACIVPHRVHHHAKQKVERAPELASSYVPPAPAPAPVAPPPPPPPAPVYAAAPSCGCGAVAVAPAPVVAYGYGYAPAIGVGIYARPGFVRPGYVGAVRPYGYGRAYAYARPGVRGYIR